MSSGVPYRITEEATARNFLRYVAKILVDGAEMPEGKLCPKLPETSFIFGKGGQIADEKGNPETVMVDESQLVKYRHCVSTGTSTEHSTLVQTEIWEVKRNFEEI